ncbi:MAG: co-chaperone GroES [Candidatus Berkelbacteria bacterium]|nr:co-chaperone GroES [Candidatus Berkelbacteria bacterium]
MIIPLNQNVLVERDNKTSGIVVRKSGIVTPTGQVENEGLVYGTVLSAPKDQNLLIDSTRAINEREVRIGDKVWYSKYSTGLVLDDREGHDGEFLDLVPLEDLRAIIE